MSHAGINDATDFLLRRLPWDLSRPHFIDNQRRQIEEITSADAGFPDHLRHAALTALRSEDPEIVARALTALAIVGTPEDLPTVRKLGSHTNPDVAKDARTSAFEIQANARGV